MQYTLRELAEILGCQLKGDPEVRIKGIAEIGSASEGDITFLTNPRYRKFLRSTKASAIIVGAPLDEPIPQLICREPYVSFAKALSIFHPEEFPPPEISDKASISGTSKIGKGVYIGDFVYIGKGTIIEDNVKVFPNTYIGDDCCIGEGSIIFPNVSIYRGVRIGKWVRIHSGAVIGSDGFGYAYSRESGKIEKVPQVGSVEIEDFVEIGANTTIDRGTIGNTVIGEGTKIDNLVQIGHNVKIGRNCFVVSQVGISGSTVIGDNVTLAGQAGVAGHLKIGSNITIAAKSGVSKDILEPGVYSGTPAIPIKEWRRIQVLIKRLPEVYEALKRFLGR